MSWMAIASRVVARKAVSSALTSKQGQTGYLAFTDYKDLIAELRKIEPKYATQLKRDFKKIAAPVRSGISKTIPKSAPTSGIHVNGAKNVSGFKPLVIPGRLSWGANSQNGNIQPRHTVVRLTKQRSFRKISQYGQMSIVKVEVDNAAVVMADMAGRSRKYINKTKVTRNYPYSRSATGSRRHRVNNQGVGMIKALNRGKRVLQSEASRWIWPAANKQLPIVQQKINETIKAANDLINERMKTR